MEFITKLHLGQDKSEKHYQCIYSSQLYGTFFSVFALVDAEYNEGDDFYTLTGIDLKIVNYKGIVNLGIEGAELIDTKSYDSEKGEMKKGKSLLLGVKGLKDTSDDFPVEIKTGSNEFKIGSHILVERFLEPMHQGAAAMAGSFDSELFYREGLHEPVKRGYTVRLWEDRPKQDSYTPPTIVTPAGVNVSGAGGWVCPFMLLMLI